VRWVHASYAANERDEIVDGGVCAGGGPFVIQIKPKARPWGTVCSSAARLQLRPAAQKMETRCLYESALAFDAGKYSRKPMSV
jgi:hypothetical protein